MRDGQKGEETIGHGEEEVGGERQSTQPSVFWEKVSS